MRARASSAPVRGGKSIGSHSRGRALRVRYPVMTGRFGFLSTILIVFLFPGTSSARTWHILANGAGDAPTIQAAIDAAEPGDTILVGPATYPENLRMISKDLVLKSDLGPDVTTIDGSGQQASTLYLSGQSRATVIEGFKITGGSGFDEGGGIFISGDSSPVIRGNLIANNGVSGFTRDGGGGRYFHLLLFASAH